MALNIVPFALCLLFIYRCIYSFWTLYGKFTVELWTGCWILFHKILLQSYVVVAIHSLTVCTLYSLHNTLFVLNLGVNLLSSRKICSQSGVKGSFDSQTMYFTCGNEKIMRVDTQGGIYVISWIAKGLEETAFCTMAPVKVN